MLTGLDQIYFESLIHLMNRLTIKYYSLFKFYIYRIYRVRFSRLFKSLLLLLWISPAAAQDFHQYFYETGEVSSEGNLLEGQPVGKWKTFYKSGVLRSEGVIEGGNSTGQWKFFTEDAIIDKEIWYKNGKKNGAHYSYTKGALKELCYYKNDILNGSCSQYNLNGIETKKEYFEDGLKNGFAFEYDTTGLVKSWAQFQEGQLLWKYWINNFNDAGKKEGKWVTFYPNENKHWEEYYVNGEKFGAFKEYSPEGELLRVVKYGFDDANLEGFDFVETKPVYHDNGVMHYEGPYNQKNEKQGLFFFYDKTGELNGGKIYIKNQLQCQGEINREGKKQGEWECFFDNGKTKSKGTYVDDVKNGEWIFYYSNGKIEQKGKYEKDKPEGEWVLYHPNGQLWRNETYENGLEHGKFEEYNRYGTLISKGKFKFGERAGKWEYYLNDIVELGSYKANEKNGLWQHFNDYDELLFEGNFQDGLPDGKHTYYFPSGQVRMEGNYFGGEKKGIWNYYQESGAKLMSVKFGVGGNPESVDGSKLPK